MTRRIVYSWIPRRLRGTLPLDPRPRPAPLQRATTAAAARVPIAAPRNPRRLKTGTMTASKPTCAGRRSRSRISSGIGAERAQRPRGAARGSSSTPRSTSSTSMPPPPRALAARAGASRNASRSPGSGSRRKSLARGDVASTCVRARSSVDARRPQQARPPAGRRHAARRARCARSPPRRRRAPPPPRGRTGGRGRTSGAVSSAGLGGATRGSAGGRPAARARGRGRSPRTTHRRRARCAPGGARTRRARAELAQPSQRRPRSRRVRDLGGELGEPRRFLHRSQRATLVKVGWSGAIDARPLSPAGRSPAARRGKASRRQPPEEGDPLVTYPSGRRGGHALVRPDAGRHVHRRRADRHHAGPDQANRSVTGTAKNGKKQFVGTYTIDRFISRGDQVLAVGKLTGRLKNRRVSRSRRCAFPVTASPTRAPQLRAPRSCAPSTLTLGPEPAWPANPAQPGQPHHRPSRARCPAAVCSATSCAGCPTS